MSDLEQPLLGEAAQPPEAPPDAKARGFWARARPASSSSEAAPSAPAAADGAADVGAAPHPDALQVRAGGPAVAAVANLSNTIIGAGIMALPKVFKVLGIIPATVVLFAVYALTHLSLNLLLRATVACGRMSFSAVIDASLGKAGTLTSQLAVIINNLGGLVVFLIIIGDVLAGRADEPGLTQPLGQPWNNRPVAVGIVVCLLHTPLCFLRRVDSLKFTSALSMCLSFMFISITLTLLADRLYSGRIGRVNWLPDADASVGDVLKTLPVMMTAYVCHYNVHPIFAEMAAPSERRMRRVVSAALLLCTATYWLVGLSAYLLFTDRTQDDVLMNYGRDLDMARGEAWVEGAVKIGYMGSLSFTFPLIQFSLRQSLFDLLGWGDAREQPLRFYAVTTLLLALEYLLAMLVPNISVAFSVLGSTVAVLIGFILPALVGVYGAAGCRRWGWALFAVGVAFGASSFSATVYGLVTSRRG